MAAGWQKVSPVRRRGMTQSLNPLGRRKVQSRGTTQSPIRWDDAESNPVGRRKVQSRVRATQSPTHWKKRSRGKLTWKLPLGDTVDTKKVDTKKWSVYLFGWFQIFVKSNKFSHFSSFALVTTWTMRRSWLPTWTLRRSYFGLGLCVGPLVPSYRSSLPSLMYSWPFRSFYYYSSPRLLTPNTASHLYVSPRLGYLTCPSSTLQVNIFKCNCHIINLLWAGSGALVPSSPWSSSKTVACQFLNDLKVKFKTPTMPYYRFSVAAYYQGKKNGVNDDHTIREGERRWEYVPANVFREFVPIFSVLNSNITSSPSRT